MRILQLHAPYFRDQWRREHDVIAYGPHAHCEVRAAAPTVHLDEVLARLPPGWEPERIVLGDDSRPLGVLGLEAAPCPTVMLSIDAHHHAAWHAPLARAVGVAFVAQRDYLPAFVSAGADDVRWLPLWAPDGLPAPAADKRHDLSFVGSLHPLFHPDRRVFLDAVGARVPLFIGSGAYAPVFGESRIVLNQTVKGDLNARVFEAMACGALLLTERTANGLLSLFGDGTEMVTYPRGDVDAVVALARYYLDDERRRREIAERGRRRVLGRHLESHRAATVLGAVTGVATVRPAAERTAGAARAYCALADAMRQRADLSPPDRAECQLRHERYLAAASALVAGGTLEEPDRSAVAGLIALERGDLGHALPALTWAARHGGRPEDHVARIEALVRSGDLHAARAATGMLCERYPSYEIGAELAATLEQLADRAQPALEPR